MSKKMGDNHHHHQQQKQKPSPVSSRLALRNAAAGEIVEVQGGHIVRSTGRKDQHSKVCSAKGPRVRRVRLSAHTAIQFYDVQDRLGYDRPSKVVDWLMKKAKPAIDVLAELPAWKPTATTVIKNMKEEQESEKGKINGIDDDDGEGMYIGRQDQNQQQQNHRICNNDNNTGLLPPSLDSNAIADTIKSFFPTGGTTTHSEEVSATSSPPVQPIQFANYPSEFMSRSRSHSQDLRLSLQQSLHPMMMHQHHHQTAQKHPFLSGAATSQHQHLVGFDHVHNHDHDHSAAGWTENQPTDMTRCQRLVTGWNTDGFMFNPPPPASQLLQPFFGQLFSQREPLQSSNNHNTTTNNPLFRAWISDSSISNATTDDQNHQMSSMHPHSLAAIGFASGGFSGFHIPARIQDDEEHDGNPNKLSASLH